MYIKRRGKKRKEGADGEKERANDNSEKKEGGGRGLSTTNVLRKARCTDISREKDRDAAVERSWRWPKKNHYNRDAILGQAIHGRHEIRNKTWRDAPWPADNPRSVPGDKGNAGEMGADYYPSITPVRYIMSIPTSRRTTNHIGRKKSPGLGARLQHLISARTVMARAKTRAVSSSRPYESEGMLQ